MNKENSKSRAEKIHELLSEASVELLEFIKETETEFPDRWVPAAIIKNRLALNLLMVPQANEIQQPKGWVFAALVRILEDNELVEYQQGENGRAFYRSC